MPDEPPSPHHFEFDLDQAILDQVVKNLEASPALPLDRGVGPAESGIYALYFKGELVYVGKASKEMTKSGRTLRTRLGEHRTKIAGRQNITPEEVTCRFLTFDSDWWVVAAEFAVIRHYAPKWNYTGFGSKVPGKGRPGTERVSTFDNDFPKKP